MDRIKEKYFRLFHTSIPVLNHGLIKFFEEVESVGRTRVALGMELHGEKGKFFMYDPFY